MSPRLSAGYRSYIGGPQWAAYRERYWRSPWRYQRCSVCGAPRRRRPALGWRWMGWTDLNHLRYRSTVHDENGQPVRSLANPHPWEVAPACHRPCHMTIITPLSRHGWLRAVVLALVAAVAVLYLGVPFLAANIVGLAILAMPRGYSAAAIGWLVGLPVRVVRTAYRIVVFLPRLAGARLPPG